MDGQSSHWGEEEARKSRAPAEQGHILLLTVLELPRGSIQMGQAVVFRAQILPAELELYWPFGTCSRKPWTETELGSGIILSDPLSMATAGMDAAFWQVNAQPLAQWCIKKPKVKTTA